MGFYLDDLMRGAPSPRGGYPPVDLEGVHPRVRRNIRKQERNIRRMGYEAPEPLPSGWEAFLDLLSGSQYAGVSALDYYRTGRNPMEGLVQGAYEGLRPGIRKGLSYLPGGANIRLPQARGKKEYWADYLQTIPGLEPTESTGRNFGIRVGGEAIGFVTDPLTYFSFGGKGAFARGSALLARKGIAVNPGRTAKEADDLFRLMAREMAPEAGMTEREVYDAVKRSFYKDPKAALEPWFLPRKISDRLSIPLITHAGAEKTGLPALARGVFSPRGMKMVSRAVTPQMRQGAVEYHETGASKWLRKMFFDETEEVIYTGGTSPAITRKITPTARGTGQPPGTIPGGTWTVDPLQPTMFPPEYGRPMPGAYPRAGYSGAAPPPVVPPAPVPQVPLNLFVRPPRGQAKILQPKLARPPAPAVVKIPVAQQRVMGKVRPGAIDTPVADAPRQADLLTAARAGEFRVPTPATSLTPKSLLQADAMQRRQLSGARMAAQADMTRVKVPPKSLTLGEWKAKAAAEMTRLEVVNPRLAEMVKTAKQKDVPAIEQVLRGEFDTARAVRQRARTGVEAERATKMGTTAPAESQVRAGSVPGYNAVVPKDRARWEHVADDIARQVDERVSEYAKRGAATPDVHTDDFLEDLSDLRLTKREAGDYSGIRQQVFAVLKNSPGKRLSELNFGNQANPLHYAPEEAAEDIAQRAGQALSKEELAHVKRARITLADAVGRNDPALGAIRKAASREELGRFGDDIERTLNRSDVPKKDREKLERAHTLLRAYFTDPEWAEKRLKLRPSGAKQKVLPGLAAPKKPAAPEKAGKFLVGDEVITPSKTQGMVVGATKAGKIRIKNPYGEYTFSENILKKVEPEHGKFSIEDNVLWHGTTEDAKSKILHEGEFAPSRGIRKYAYSEYGPNVSYFTEGTDSGFTALSPQRAQDGRMIFNPTRIRAELTPGAKVVILDTMEKADAFAVQHGEKDFRALQRRLGVELDDDPTFALDRRDAQNLVDKITKNEVDAIAIRTSEDAALDALTSSQVVVFNNRAVRPSFRTEGPPSWTEAKHTRIALDDALRQGHVSREEYDSVQKALNVSRAFRDNLEVRFLPGEAQVSAAGLRAHGDTSASVQFVKGHADLQDAGKSLITLTSRGLKDPETIHHEAWHFAHKYLLREKEREFLREARSAVGHMAKGNYEEWAADQFARFMLDKPIATNLWGHLRAITRRLWRVIKAVAGDKSAKMAELFERALKRQYRPAPTTAQAARILAETPKFSLHPGVTIFDPGGVTGVKVGKGALEKITVYKRKPILYLLDNALTWLSPTFRISPMLGESARMMKAREIGDKEHMLEAVTKFGKHFEGHMKDFDEFYKFIEPQSTPANFSRDQLRRFTSAKKEWDMWFDKTTGLVPNMLRHRGLHAEFLDEYITHIYKLDHETYSRLLNLRSSGALSGFDKYTMQREIETIEKALTLGKKPIVNAAVLMGIRIESAQAAIRRIDYLNQLISEGGARGLVKRIPKGMTEFRFKEAKKFEGYVIPHRFPQLAKSFKHTTEEGAERLYLTGYAVRDDVAIHLGHLFEGWRQPHFLGDILHKITKMWKPLATIYSPKYHLRNMWGNIWNAFLGDLRNPVRYLQSFAVQSDKMAASLGIKSLKIGGKTYTPKELRAHLQELGVSGKGYFGTDLEMLIHERILGRQAKMLTPAKVNEWARSGGQFIEDNARIALWLDARMKGMSDIEAANHVRKFLFDYDELTPSERRIREYIAPWYTWARKNIPLQFEMLLRQPGKFTLPVHLQAVLETKQERQKKETIAPEWMRERQAFSSPLIPPTKAGDIRYIMPGMPYEDITRFGDPREWINQLNPVLKGAMEQALSQDFFTGRPFYPEGVKNDPALQLQRVEPGWAKVVPKQLHPLFNIRQYIDPSTGKTVTVASPRAVHLWKLAFRPGREIMQLTDTDRDAVAKWANYATGFSVYPLNEARARMMKGYSRRERNKAVLRQLYQTQGTPYRRRHY